MAVQRRLAAILAADVAGYSRLMGEDEEGTRAKFNNCLDKIVRPALEEHGGRLVKTMGDGLLVEFVSVLGAVQAAIDIQSGWSRYQQAEPHDNRLELRIGIHSGDVIVEGDDIHGDGVNIAARLEGIAERGGICISDVVHVGIRNKLAIEFEDLGNQSLKNIAEPVQVFRVALEPPGQKLGMTSDALFRRPAVAVLPFENLSGDPDQEFFADGLTEDLITALSLWRSFPVIARNSTFSYKGISPDIRTVGEELGARYVIEGSVQRSGDRVRVTAQLINSETGHHIWVNRFDHGLGDVFELQDELTHEIATVIEPTIGRSEGRRASVKSPSDLAAWESVLRGFELIYEETKEANQEARRTFKRAIEIDPQFARAHSGLAYTYIKDLRFFGADDANKWSSLCFESARRATELDEMDSEARTMLARAFASVGDFESSIAEARHAVELNPFDPYAKNVLGYQLAIVAGRFEEGIPLFVQSAKLSQKDPQLHIFFGNLCLAYLGAGRYEKAIESAREAIRRRPTYFESVVTLAAAQGYLGQNEEAKTTIEPFAAEARERVERNALFGRKIKDAILDGLRKAGLPE